jgi:hypothetical protein
MTADPGDLTWPPHLDLLKLDLKVPADQTRDNDRMQLDLNAAVAYVERVRRGSVDFTATGSPLLVPVDSDLILGTVRLAGRWLARGRSPDGMVSSTEFGSVRIGTGDADIDRMLRVGRYARPVLA